MYANKRKSASPSCKSEPANATTRAVLALTSIIPIKVSTGINMSNDKFILQIATTFRSWINYYKLLFGFSRTKFSKKPYFFTRFLAKAIFTFPSLFHDLKGRGYCYIKYHHAKIIRNDNKITPAKNHNM